MVLPVLLAHLGQAAAGKWQLGILCGDFGVFVSK